jgi:hypothetical protein
MLLSGVFLAGSIVVLGLALYTKLADVRTFGQINNLLVFAVALLLMAIYPAADRPRRRLVRQPGPGPMPLRAGRWAASASAAHDALSTDRVA